MKYDTFSEAGYVYIMQCEDKTHVLWNKSTRNFERWTANKNHASYGLKYKNTHLEFCSSYAQSAREHLIGAMRAIQNFGEQHHAFHSTLMNAYRKHIAV